MSSEKEDKKTPVKQLEALACFTIAPYDLTKTECSQVTGSYLTS